MVKGWYGVYQWTQFFYKTRVESSMGTPQARRNNLETLCATWFSISRTPAVAKVILDTEGSVELLVRMWLREDDFPGTQTYHYFSTPTAALYSLLKQSQHDTLDRLVAAAGGPEKVTFLAELVLSRLRPILKRPDHLLKAVNDLELIDHLSRDKSHLIRHAFLNSKTSKTVPLYTGVLLTLSTLLDRGPEPLLAVVVATFGYIRNHIESTDGFTWVIQAINAGLLKAFVQSSPHFFKLSPVDRDMIFYIFENIIPRYLIYKSVILAASHALKSVKDHSPVERSVANSVWHKLTDLVEARMSAIAFAKTIKGKGASCDNVKCQKVDNKSNFQKCSGCGTALYCTKECQVEAWKRGDHRTVCALRQKEYMNGRKHELSRSDQTFLHTLSIFHTKMRQKELREEGQTQYPDVPLENLLVVINYTAVPLTFTVCPIAQYSHPSTVNTSFDRNDAMFQRVKENPGKYSLIQSLTSNGETSNLVTTSVLGSVLKDSEDKIDWIRAIEDIGA